MDVFIIFLMVCPQHDPFGQIWTYLTNNEDKNNKDMMVHPKKIKIQLVSPKKIKIQWVSPKNKKKRPRGDMGGVPPVLFDPLDDVKSMPQTHTPIMRRSVGVQCDVGIMTPRRIRFVKQVKTLFVVKLELEFTERVSSRDKWAAVVPSGDHVSVMNVLERT